MENITSNLLKLLKKYDLPDTFLLEVIRAAWPEIVGKYLSERLFPKSLIGVKLIISVSDIRLLQKMNPVMISREIRKNIFSLFPDIEVKRIRFESGRVPAPGKKPAPRPDPGPPKALPKSLLETAETIEDPDLRRRFLEFAAKGLAVESLKSEKTRR